MPLTYDQTSRLKALAPVLDEHSEWFGRVVRHVAYPELDQNRQMLTIPDSYKKWAGEAQRSETVAYETLDRLGRVYNDLQATATHLLQSTLPGNRPDVRLFDSFVTLYEEFVTHIRRLERDQALTDSGFDVLTGLRTRQVMTHDIERELERRARRGRPFCLALARIDHHDQIKAHLSQDDYNLLMKAAAAIIKQCIRSFDDAYHLADGEFLMSLKQTELLGGSASLNRLRKLLEEQAPYYTIKGKQHRLAMSSCVAEPQPGDSLEELLRNMRADLNKYEGEGEAVVEYVELSPVLRFLSDLEDVSKKSH